MPIVTKSPEILQKTVKRFEDAGVEVAGVRQHHDVGAELVRINTEELGQVLRADLLLTLETFTDQGVRATLIERKNLGARIRVLLAHPNDVDQNADTAMVLRSYPGLNSMIRRGAIWQRRDVDVFLQVAVPSEKAEACPSCICCTESV